MLVGRRSGVMHLLLLRGGRVLTVVRDGRLGIEVN